MRRRTHRAVLTRGIHSARRALRRRHVVGRPTGNFKFRMLGVIAARDVVMVFKQHLAIGGHEHGTKGLITQFQRALGQLDAAGQVLFV
ncbi:hypothetical protein D3C81_2056160 [compost metagenome]